VTFRNVHIYNLYYYVQVVFVYYRLYVLIDLRYCVLCVIQSYLCGTTNDGDDDDDSRC